VDRSDKLSTRTITWTSQSRPRTRRPDFENSELENLFRLALRLMSRAGVICHIGSLLGESERAIQLPFYGILAVRLFVDVVQSAGYGD